MSTNGVDENVETDEDGGSTGVGGSIGELGGGDGKSALTRALAAGGQRLQARSSTVQLAANQSVQMVFSKHLGTIWQK